MDLSPKQIEIRDKLKHLTPDERARAIALLKQMIPNNNLEALTANIKKPMQTNWQGVSVPVQADANEPLTSYTQVLQQQEAEPHYNVLMERLEKLKVEQSKKL